MQNPEIPLIENLKYFVQQLNSLYERIRRFDLFVAAQAVVTAKPEERDEAISRLSVALDIFLLSRCNWQPQQFELKNIQGNAFLLLQLNLADAPQMLLRSQKNINGIPVEFIGWKILPDQRIELKFLILQKK